jgi:hypoxanthine phosphoribosyltransferase
MSFQISQRKIKARIKQLAVEINNYYKKKNVSEIHFIFITTSSFVFASDLIRQLFHCGIKIQSEHISIRSYSGVESSEIFLREEELDRMNLDERVVLIVDDILDTGRTLTYLYTAIRRLYNPLMIDFCCLMRKRGRERNLNFNVKFIGFDIPNVFVVGYGLDYNGLYRELPFIKELQFN